MADEQTNGAPAGTTVSVLQGFAYNPHPEAQPGDPDFQLDHWFTPATPSADVLRLVPMDVLEAHEATGYVRINRPAATPLEG